MVNGLNSKRWCTLLASSVHRSLSYYSCFGVSKLGYISKIHVRVRLKYAEVCRVLKGTRGFEEVYDRCYIRHQVHLLQHSATITKNRPARRNRGGGG